jgi:hypothetical protein
MITLVERDELKGAARWPRGGSVGAAGARARNYACGRFAIRERVVSIHWGRVIGKDYALIDGTTARQRGHAAGDRLMEPKALRIV